MPKRYRVDTQTHYKIWFSEKKNCFLPFENQLRFIKMRQDNPTARLTFLYSAKCLNLFALKKLKEFCKEHRIVSVNFDKINTNRLDASDKVLYQIAQDEITHNLNKEGGCMAGASDCVRLMVYIINKYGNYSDYDVGVTVKDKPAIVEVDMPILIPTGTYFLRMPRQIEGVSVTRNLSVQIPSINNDTLVVARDKNNSAELHADALEKIRRLQFEVISCYSDTSKWVREYFSPHFCVEGTFDVISKIAPLQRYIMSYIEQNPKASIFAFRKHIQTLNFKTFMQSLMPEERIQLFGRNDLSDISEDEAKEAFSKIMHHFIGGMKDPEAILKLLKHKMYINSVSNFAGPKRYESLVNPTKMQFILKRTTLGQSIEPANEWANLLAVVKKMALEKNLPGCFHSPNLTSNFQKIQAVTKAHRDPKDQIGRLGDLSWTPLGEENQQKHFDKMVKAEKTIARAWQKYKSYKTKPDSQIELDNLAKRAKANVAQRRSKKSAGISSL